MTEPLIGEQAVCGMCHERIIFVGSSWDHMGENKPRHPAIPEDEWNALRAKPRYELVSRATCQYCLGSAVCYECGGLTSCEECVGGICAHCENGRETWLMFEHDGKRRGSCLNRAEIVAWRERQELPEWWAGYYGIKEDTHG